MKKSIKFIFTFILIAMTLTGCGNNDVPTPPVKEIVVEALTDNVIIKDSEIPMFDFTSLFKITEDGKNVIVENAFIDTSKLLFTPGIYPVTCKYLDKEASINVTVKGVEYKIDLSVEKMTINVSECMDYDYQKLFNVTVDGRQVELTPSMIQTDLKQEIGEYSYTVTIGDVSKTLKIVVVDLHEIEIIPSYNVFEIEIGKLQTFDFTKLFQLYVDGVAKDVTLEMLDLSGISNLNVGDTATIKISYSEGQSTTNNKIDIKILEDEQVIITARNVITYPNEEYIDLTTLFEITKGGKKIPVTMDMITGGIDYTKIGLNEIVINYEGQSKTAIVEIKRGVVIKYATSDTITVLKGTNKDLYPFSHDFIVAINGIEFDNISFSYLDISSVDFNTKGKYQVTLKIPYNESPLGLRPKFDYYEKTITYVVVDNNYDISVNNDLVIIDTTTNKKFDPYKNLTVYINGLKQTLTENSSYVDKISCYVQTVSDPIDYNNYAEQVVKIAIYVDGPDANPVFVSYKAVIKTSIEITPHDRVYFTGSTIYKKDLFSIKNNGQNVEVTDEMVSGILDPFTPGIYRLTISYQNIEKEVVVTIYDNSLKGIYHTALTTFNDNWGITGQDEGFIPRRVGTLEIAEDGSIVLDGSPATIISSVNENTLILKYKNNEYTLYHENGIVVLIPVNKELLRYNNSKRPFMYFNDSIWKLKEHFVINNSNKYVLDADYKTYSLDIFHVLNKQTKEDLYYGMKTELSSKYMADTEYKVTYGKAQMADNFEPVANLQSSLTLNNDDYVFVLDTPYNGRIDKDYFQAKYANMNFTGLIDGKKAELRADKSECFSLYIDGNMIFKLTTLEMNGLKEGSINYITDTVHIYQVDHDEFSYKFKLNVLDQTFEYIPKDNYYGKFYYEDKYIFLDGYGNGFINVTPKMYYKTELKYNVSGSYINIEFINPSHDWEYGDYLIATIDIFNNVLSIKENVNSTIDGKDFEKKVITDGLIIKIKSNTVGKNTDSVAKQELYDNIDIITKDGIVPNSEKAKWIDTSKVRFSTPGYYQLIIKGYLNEEEVLSYYAVEVLDDYLKDSPIVATYGTGVMLEHNSLMIDKFGRAIFDLSGNKFIGRVNLLDENNFVIFALNDKGEEIVVKGNMLTKGLILVNCTGSASFQDYFTTGTVNYIGTKNVILREIIIGNDIIYLYSNSPKSSGSVAEVESLNGIPVNNVGSIFKITSGEKELIVKSVSWNDMIHGLLISDNFRGIYKSNLDTLELDGFGEAIYNSNIGKYVMNDNVVTYNYQNDTYLFRLLTNNTFEKVDFVMDNGVLEGKTFSSKYIFTCQENGAYYAITDFIFKENGVVTVLSESPEHDDPENGCGDKYSPLFANQEGVNGTYIVKGNTVSIKVNSYTITFNINNVLNAKVLTCTSTTIPEDSHGYFSVSTIFNVK